MAEAAIRCPACGKVWAQGDEQAEIECPECFARIMENIRTKRWKTDMAKRHLRFQPELGQAVFGNPWGEFEMGDDVETYATSEIEALIDRVGHGKHLDEAVGPDFELRSYVWDECSCDGQGTCKACLPNFRVGDIEIRWYKHPGRGMSVNRPVTRAEMERAFDRVRVLVAAGLVKVPD